MDTNTGFCPKCGQPRQVGADFCPTCGQDLRAATTAATPSPAAAPRRANGGLWVILLVVVIGAALVATGSLNDVLDRIGAKGVSAEDLPPAGVVWFGDSFDPNTFAIAGRKTTTSSTGPFSMVAHLSKSMKGSDLVIRIYYAGSLITTTSVNSTDFGDTWGLSPGPLFQAGVWRYDFTDVGGNILATGSITAT